MVKKSKSYQGWKLMIKTNFLSFSDLTLLVTSSDRLPQILAGYKLPFCVEMMFLLCIKKYVAPEGSSKIVG